MRALRLFIVSGPYEGERIRRAMEEVGLDAHVAEAELPPLAPGDGVLAAINRGDTEPRATLERLRARIGDGVPLLVVGEPSIAEVVAEMTHDFFPRPLAVELLIERVRTYAPPRQGEPGLVSSQPGGAGAPSPNASLEPPAAPFPASPSASGTAVVPPAPASHLDRLGASIDQALDQTLERELLEAAGIVTSPKADWAGAPPTLTVPEELMQSILASTAASEARPAASALAATASRPFGAASLASASPVSASPVSASPAVSRSSSRRREPEVEEDLDLPALLGRAFTEAYTGRMRLRRGETEKNVFFEVGRPVLASSNAVEDRMIEIFLRQRRISPEQHREAVRAAAETNRRMGTLLIELGIMKSDELLPAVREHYEEIISSLFTWPRASVRREAGAVADPRRVRLLRHPVALAYAGLQRISDRAWLAGRLGEAGQRLRVVSGLGASELLGELAIEPGLRGAITLFDGTRALDEVLRSSGQEPEVLLRLANVLQAFGGLEVASVVPEAGGHAQDDRITRDRLMARHRLVREGDYFEILGLGRDAGTAEVLRAHARLCSDLEPRVVGAALAQELAGAIREIRVVADEALRILATDAQRSAYLAALDPPAGGASQPAVALEADQRVGGAEEPLPALRAPEDAAGPEASALSSPAPPSSPASPSAE